MTFKDFTFYSGTIQLFVLITIYLSTISSAFGASFPPESSTTSRYTDSLALVALVLNTEENGAWNSRWDFNRPMDTWRGLKLNKEGRVSEIRIFSNKNIVGEIPSEIGDLEELEVFIIMRNKLNGSLPAEIGKLKKLRVINFFNNKIERLPTEIGELESLTNLGMSLNNISGSIPKELGNLENLRTLHLQHNHFSGTVPAELGQLKNLQHLLLQDNGLSLSLIHI